MAAGSMPRVGTLDDDGSCSNVRDRLRNQTRGRSGRLGSVRVVRALSMIFSGWSFRWPSGTFPLLQAQMAASAIPEPCRSDDDLMVPLLQAQIGVSAFLEPRGLKTALTVLLPQAQWSCVCGNGKVWSRPCHLPSRTKHIHT